MRTVFKFPDARKVPRTALGTVEDVLATSWADSRHFSWLSYELWSLFQYPWRIHGAGIYANIGGILMGSMLPYIAYMDPMGYICICVYPLYMYLSIFIYTYIVCSYVSCCINIYPLRTSFSFCSSRTALAPRNVCRVGCWAASSAASRNVNVAAVNEGSNTTGRAGIIAMAKFRESHGIVGLCCVLIFYMWFITYVYIYIYTYVYIYIYAQNGHTMRYTLQCHVACSSISKILMSFDDFPSEKKHASLVWTAWTSPVFKVSESPRTRIHIIIRKKMEIGKVALKQWLNYFSILLNRFIRLPQLGSTEKKRSSQLPSTSLSSIWWWTFPLWWSLCLFVPWLAGKSHKNRAL